MKQNYDIILFGSFGNPNDFRQTNVIKNQFLSKQKLFDIDANYIKVFQNTTLYSLRREKNNGFNCISYAKYFHANELKSTREGTFVGAAVTFINKNYLSNNLASYLDEILDNLISDPLNLIDKKTFRINHSDKFQFSLNKIKDIDKIEHNLIEIESSLINSSDRKALIFFKDSYNFQCRIKEFEKLLIKYETIYFTSDKTIAEYTNFKSKGLITVLDTERAKLEITEVEKKIAQHEIEAERKVIEEKERRAKEEAEIQKRDKENKWEFNKRQKNDLKNQKTYDDVVNQIDFLQKTIKDLRQENRNYKSRLSEHYHPIERGSRIQHKKEDKGFSKLYISYGIIVLFVILLIGSLFYFSYKVDDLENKIISIENEKKDYEEKEQERLQKEEKDRLQNAGNKKSTEESEKIKKAQQERAKKQEAQRKVEKKKNDKKKVNKSHNKNVSNKKETKSDKKNNKR
jgi:hypothetical protein